MSGTHCAPLIPSAFQEPWSESLILSRSRLVSSEDDASQHSRDNAVVGGDEEEEDEEEEAEDESSNGWEKVV